MTAPANDTIVVAGVKPWLPWPLSAWTWWTQPVSAERLAILRIGLSVCLLVDLWINYRPHIQDFFGAGGLGDPELFAWYARAPSWEWSVARGVGSPRWNWSLLRGLGDPLVSTLIILGWVLVSGWLVLDLVASF